MKKLPAAEKQIPIDEAKIHKLLMNPSSVLLGCYES